MILAAGILFQAADGRVLLLRRSAEGDHAGEWSLPGGKVEPGETAAQAAIREAEEEIGLNPAWSESRDSMALLCRRQRDGVDWTTFRQPVPAPFDPVMNGEHDAFAWALPTELPEPLHPGVRVAIDRLGMDELGVARAIAAGELTSPQRYGKMALVDMRITGTGASYRDQHDEYVWRDPSLYLTDDFLARCNGLPVIMEHPDAGRLDSDEYGARVVGAIMLPYVKQNEVWGIARIQDDATIRLIERRPLSTSPAVVFRPADGNETRKMANGSTLLIEGKPYLLDHLAICEVGVWDKGGAPSGVAATVNDGGATVPGEDQTKNVDPKADNANPDPNADLGAKLDKLLGVVDSMHQRMDALEGKGAEGGDGNGQPAPKPAAPPAQAAAPAADNGGTEFPPEIASMPRETEADRIRYDAACAGYTAQQKARADNAAAEAEKLAAERADKARADSRVSALESELAALRKQMPAPDPESDPAELAKWQARADAVYAQHGAQAPRPLAGEGVLAYRRRLAAGMQPHSAAWKDIALADLPEPVIARAEDAIYADAATAARNPVGLPDGELRPIQHKDETGRIITTWAGSPSAWLDQFRIPRRRVSAFNTDRKGV